MAEYLIDALEARKDYTQCVIVPFLVRRYVKNLLTAPFDMLRKRIELLGSTSPEANIKSEANLWCLGSKWLDLYALDGLVEWFNADGVHAPLVPCPICGAARILPSEAAYGTTTTWWRRADGEWWCATCYYEKLILSSHEGLNMDGMMSMTVEGDKGPRTVPEQDYTEAELDFGPEDMNMGGPHYHLTLPPPARPSTSPVLPRPPPGPKTERPPPVPKTERLSARRPKAATKK